MKYTKPTVTTINQEPQPRSTCSKSLAVEGGLNTLLVTVHSIAQVKIFLVSNIIKMY